MFLFTKRSKKVIKWVWGVFAVLVALSMVFTYSGFSMLSRTQEDTASDIPPEVLAELQKQQQNATNTPEIQALLDQLNASGTVKVTDPTIERSTGTPELPPAPEPVAPPVPPLQFGL